MSQISQVKLDGLRRILARKGEKAYAVAFDAEGVTQDDESIDLDLLRDLVTLASGDPPVSVEDAYKAGFDHGWEECVESATIDAYKGPRAAENSWKIYKADEKL